MPAESEILATDDHPAPPRPGLDAAAVARACYRQLLGREPENDQVVEANAALPTYDALLAAFTTSDEYIRRSPPHTHGLYAAPRPPIDVRVSPQTLDAMFQRIRTEWSRLGEADPYWSVLTDEAYRGRDVDEADLAAFYASGAETAALIDTFAARSGVAVDPDGVCLEFGCGVGRVTLALARRFRKVIAVDVSAGNLALCRRALAAAGAENVETILIAAPEDVASLPGFDFLFSTIVFQHNPPPVQHHLLDILLSKIARPGGFLFQTPTHTPGYAFDAEAYLASPPDGMEMHCLPMPEVLRLISRHGLAPLEVIMDAWTGLYGSHTFFGVDAARG